MVERTWRGSGEDDQNCRVKSFVGSRALEDYGQRHENNDGVEGSRWYSEGRMVLCGAGLDYCDPGNVSRSKFNCIGIRSCLRG